MRRLFATTAAALLVLGLAAPAVLAADVAPHGGRVIISFNGPLDVPAGDQADVVVVGNGDATIEGDVSAILVMNGNATLDGATADTLVVINGNAVLMDGTVVRGDVRTLNGQVQQSSGATVQGSIRGLETELAALGFVLVPAFLLLTIGLALITIVAALVVAALGARQTRSAEALISRQPGPTIVAGLVGIVVLPIVAVLAMMTVVGAPIGLALLLIVLPAVAYLGWIVAAIWIGDWLVIRMRGAAEPERPYLAAVIGVVILGLASLIPPISAIASLFGFGAVLLLAWKVARHEPLLPPEVPKAAPVATAA